MTMQAKLALLFILFFFFNDPATTEIYTLSLPDALPISQFFQLCRDTFQGRPVPAANRYRSAQHCQTMRDRAADAAAPSGNQDRKSTRLNSSHSQISYAVFCLKKKKR